MAGGRGEALRRLARSARRVLRTRYPAFLFGGTLGGEVPVFVYHDVEPEAFAADLAFLRRNGYRTLSLGELVQAGGRSAAPAVALTFDDARRNFAEVAFPILEEFDARAALFVPTGWMRGPARAAEATGSEPAGHDRAPTTPAPDEEREAFMSWDELRRCADSGRVELGLHGHRHALVHASTRLVGFATPEALRRHDVYDWPMRREVGGAGGRWVDRLGRPAPGTPVYEALPLLSAPARVLEPGGASEACRARVAQEGAEAFFARPRAVWEAELRRVHDRAAGEPRRMEGAAFDALVASELELGQERFRRELGRPARTFAYPWMLGSARSFELALEHGIDAVFGVGIDFRRARALSRRRPTFGRLKGDWLRLLPGEGRARLRDVVSGRARAFAGSQHLAH